MSLIKNQWESYRNGVFPPDVSPIQIQENRRAFYSGFSACFSVLIEGLDPNEEPTEDDYVKVERLHVEIREFIVDMLKGDA